MHHRSRTFAHTWAHFAPAFLPNSILHALTAAFLFAASTRADPADTTLRLEASGTYLMAPAGLTNLAPQADYTLVAQLSSTGKYRLAIRYQNRREVLLFDGTNTVAHTSVLDQAGKPLGAQVVLLSGPFPEYLPGYIQASWMATYLNRSLQTSAALRIKHYLSRTAYLHNLLGAELLPQLRITNTTTRETVTIRVYVPGNATKQGHPVFASPAYTNGLMFQELKLSDFDPQYQIFRSLELNNCRPYREPASPNDVLIWEKEYVRITRLLLTTSMSLDLPEIAGSVAVRDYSTPAGTNRAVPLAYSISSWSQLTHAQELARKANDAPTPANGRWLWIIVISSCFTPLVLKTLLVRRQQRHRSAVSPTEKRNV